MINILVYINGEKRNIKSIIENLIKEKFFNSFFEKNIELIIRKNDK
jgi:hypothetical protein